jgi:hypothetical protein
MKSFSKLLLLLLFIFIILSGCKKEVKAPVQQEDNLAVTGYVDKNVSKPPKKVEITIPENVLETLKTVSPVRNKQELRKFPYPYNAMLSICSDIDNTTLDEFELYHRFLNTKEETQYGKGVGLDIGDSMWMYMGSSFPETTDQKGSGQDKVFTYFTGTDTSKPHYPDKIKRYYKAGWIDSLHTYGDFSRVNIKDIYFKRQYAIDAWKILNDEDIKFKIWINHGNEGNKQNFGAYANGAFYHYQEGDDPKSQYYHTDLIIKNGIKFLWNSRGETDFGVDDPLFPIKLRDGKSLWGFHRYTNDITNNKIDWTWTPGSIYKQLTKERLDQLVQKQQYSIVAQHFGVSGNELFNQKNIDALKLLTDYKDNGRILVARTSRLLNYSLMQSNIKYSIIKDDEKTWINIHSISDPIFGDSKPELDDIRGLTFYTENPEKTFLLLDSKIISSDLIQRNLEDSTNKKSIAVKWFYDDTTDYTK